MICRIADLNIDFVNSSPAFNNYLKPYATTDKNVDIAVSITSEDITHAREKASVPYNDFQAEYSAFYIKTLPTLPAKNAIILHGSLIDYNGTGILFTAHSGTGKTTHSLLWQKLFKENVQIINGDKPIIRFNENGTLYGYGAPWCGKEKYGANARTHLKHICFIERSLTNSCERITAQDALNKIFDQIFIPKDKLAAANTLSILDKALNSCNIWLLKCNMDIEAAQVAYNSIFKEN